MTRLLLPIDQIAQNFIEAHARTNHFYDKYLPYEFHLRMVVYNILEDEDIAKKVIAHYDTVDFRHVHPSFANLLPVKFEMDHIVGGGWGHDSGEDARLTFNNMVEMTSRIEKSGQKDITVAMICRALTSDPTGIDRNGRMTEEVYHRIRSTPGATFDKLQDRKANVKYGLMTGGTMPRKYKKENPEFLKKLSGTPEFEICAPVVQQLEDLFKQVKDARHHHMRNV